MKDLLAATPAKSPLRFLLVSAAVVVVLAGMKLAAWFVNLVLLALLITLLTYPFMAWLRERGRSPRAAYAIAVGAVLAGALLIVLIGGISLAQAASEVPEYVQRFEANMAAVNTGATGSAVNQAAGTVLKLIATVGENVVNLVVFVAFMLITVVYMLAEVDSFTALVRRTLGVENPRRKLLAESTSAVVTYMSITARINFVIAVADVILLWVIGVPNVLLWGLVSFLFGFIPYVGYWISFVPPAIIAFGIGGIPAAAAVTIGYFLINGLINQLVAPRLYGKGLNLSVTLTLVAVFFWGWLLGSVGGILAVPLTAVIRTGLLGNFSETEWLSTILSDNRAAQPEVAAEASVAATQDEPGKTGAAS